MEHIIEELEKVIMQVESGHDSVMLMRLNNILLNVRLEQIGKVKTNKRLLEMKGEFLNKLDEQFKTN